MIHETYAVTQCLQSICSPRVAVPSPAWRNGSENLTQIVVCNVTLTYAKLCNLIICFFEVARRSLKCYRDKQQ